MMAYASRGEAIAREILELQAYFTDNTFATAGAQAITDADAQAAFPWLTAALVNSGMTALNTLLLSPANRTILRQVCNVPVP